MPNQPNPFAQLFGGLFAKPTPKQTFMSSLSPTANMSTPAGPKYGGAPTAPNTNIIPSNTGATTAIKPAATNSPAKQQYIQSQTQSVAPPVTPQQPITGNTQTPSGATINASTGDLVTPPPVDPKQSYTDAFSAYLSSLQPSSDETAATTKLNADTLQSQKDQETALNSGETLGFASGETARVNRNNSFQTTADANALNALTARRTSTTDAQKARLDFEKSLLPSTDSFNLSAGETRYGPDGKAIATAPAAQTAPKIIGDSSTGYYTVGNDGKLSPLLGAAPKSLNASQTQSQGYALINQLLGTSDENGTPYVDSNGYFTPEGFKSIVQNAAEDGLSRADILSEYGDKIYGPSASKYGLTPKEKTDLGIA